MPRMPGATWLGEHSPHSAMTRYDIVCVHTIVGFAPAHAAHFSTKADGTILQSRDTAYRSAANLNGNHRIIAIENEDHGPRFGGTPRLPAWVPLTPEQVEACAKILAWAHRVHGIPLQLCPDSKPGSRGLGYHRQGIDGNFGGYRFPGRVDGGEVWTSSFGKVCPTDVRIAQLPKILARAKALVQGDDDDMNDADRKMLAAVAAATTKIGGDVTSLAARVEALHARINSTATHERERDTATRGRFAALKAQLVEVIAILKAGGDEPTPKV